jgi:photosystem II stability/assembly factor-like uncharacterized protein
MKKITLLYHSFFIFLFFSSAQAQWTLAPRVTTEPLADLVYCSSDTVFASGANGAMVMSTDKGLSWSKVNIGTSDHLPAVASPEPQVVYAVGGRNQSKIFKTEDGGTTWDSLNFFDAVQFMNIHFISKDTGIAVGFSGLMLRTADAGKTWSKIDPNTNANLYSIHFAGNDTGYAVGWNNTIIKTTNGGLNWQVLNHNIASWVRFTDVHFITADTGFVVGTGIYKTTDGGLSWNSVGPRFFRQLNDIEFVDNSHGYAVGGIGGILETHDQGATWSIDTFGFFDPSWGYGWFGIAIDGNNLLIGGHDGKIARPGCRKIEIDSITNCQPITWLDGFRYSENNFTATHVFQANGTRLCDSIVVLDYKRPLPTTSLTISGDTIIAMHQQGPYQWLSCDSSHTVIPGATNRWFLPPTSGSYAVIITSPEGCVDTSHCYRKRYLSEEQEQRKEPLIYPNPSEGIVYIQTDVIEAFSVRIYTTQGQMVNQMERTNAGPISLKLDSGIYLVEIESKNYRRITRLIVR